MECEGRSRDRREGETEGKKRDGKCGGKKEEEINKHRRPEKERNLKVIKKTRKG